MLSIGDLVDKLVVENIKLFNIREEMHKGTLGDDEYVQANIKMMTINDNRGIIIKFLDKKISNVISGKEPNVILKNVKTYEQQK